MPKKGKKADTRQASMFDAEVEEEVDLHKEPPAKVEPEVLVKPPGTPMLRIVIGSTKSCPHCGEDIKLAPDGTVRCTKCWWWQGLSE